MRITIRDQLEAWKENANAPFSFALSWFSFPLGENMPLNVDLYLGGMQDDNPISYVHADVYRF